MANLYHIAKANSEVLIYHKYMQRVITNKLNIKGELKYGLFKYH